MNEFTAVAFLIHRLRDHPPSPYLHGPRCLPIPSFGLIKIDPKKKSLSFLNLISGLSLFPLHSVLSSVIRHRPLLASLSARLSSSTTAAPLSDFAPMVKLAGRFPAQMEALSVQVRAVIFLLFFFFVFCFSVRQICSRLQRRRSSNRSRSHRAPNTIRRRTATPLCPRVFSRYFFVFSYLCNQAGSADRLSSSGQCFAVARVCAFCTHQRCSSMV